MNQFVKSHGLGNDYFVLDQSQLSFDLTPEVVQLLCHRNYGIGSDGILLLVPSDKADFGLRILNPDGSEAEKSGNGLRIFAKYLFEHGHTEKEVFKISTLGGVVTAELETTDGIVPFVTVEMGEATFQSNLIPVAGEEREVVDEEINVDGELLRFTAVSVGNPHCVVFVDELDEGYIRKLGPLLETHELFPNRINVQFAKPLSREKVQILIWERGAGYTLASGSSSCAVASACVKNGLTDGNVTVSMPGGDLDINIRNDWSIKMRGAVEEVAEGTLSIDLLKRIEMLSG
ncbi:MAG: diaminopimelate epimerase [Candidatus Dadabacteria bacterium]|nr:diaminopimelate epimerase [Candidatus Dadabacteria bacterium]MCZ6639433.1 diaminopimelate epimerase [Candidatus Dadabacteria bacterium]MCZ6864083.1 diaminopimelate epimerase [Candidatus Dadabacteria bacterium]